MPKNENDYALVIGIDHYPQFRSLVGAIDDAKDFVNWLLNDREGGGVPDKNCKLVLSQENPVRPIHDDIDDNLLAILKATENKKGRRLYLYFSGHGLARKNVGADLCLAKWSQDRRSMALDSEDYLNLVAGSGLFTEVAFFLDCCRVRKIGAKALPSTIGLARPESDAAANRSFIAYATEFLNPAYEAEIAGAGSAGGEDSLVRGHFTRALLAGLRGGAAAANGGVPARRLKAYLEIETKRIAKEAGHNQQPEVVNGFKVENEPIFGAARPEANLEISFSARRKGIIILEGPELEIIKRGDVSTGPWNLKLTKGVHTLREEQSGEEMVLRFRPAEGVSHVEF